MDYFNYGILITASIVPRFMRLEKAAAAIASHSLEKAQEKAKEWNIPRSYGSYEALLEDEDINVVYVAMINSQHYK